MCDIVLPAAFEELEHASVSNGFFIDQQDIDVSGIPEGDIEDLLNVANFCTDEEEGSTGIPQAKIDLMFTLVSKMDQLPNSSKHLTAEVFSELAGQCVQLSGSPGIVQRQKNGIKIVFYFFLVLCSKFEAVAKKANEKSADTVIVPKSKGRGKKSKKLAEDEDGEEGASFSTTFWRAQLLATVQAIIEVDSSLIWTMGIVHESFLMLLTKLPLAVLEGDGSSPDAALKALSTTAIVDFSAKYPSGCNYLITAFIDAICRAEHMGAIVSDILKRTNGLLAAELMQEIGHINMADVAKSGNGVKNIGIFLVSFAEACPALVAQHLPSIMHQIDSEVYQIRSALLQAIGVVVSYIHRSQTEETEMEKEAALTEDNEHLQKNTEYLSRVRETMLDVMVERTYDNNSFTRAAVIKVWTSLVEAGSVPVRRVGYVAEIALDRMADRTAAVRKASVLLLTTLLECNPFNANLDIEIFKRRAEELTTAFDARVAVIKEMVMGDSEETGMDGIDEDPHSKAEAEIKNDEFMASEDVIQDPDIVAIVAEKEYCNSALKLLEVSHDCVHIRVSHLLTSFLYMNSIECLGRRNSDAEGGRIDKIKDCE